MSKADYARCWTLAQKIVEFDAMRGAANDVNAVFRKLVAGQRVHEDCIDGLLAQIYAVSSNPPREHALIFCGTEDEFAYFKHTLSDWAKKRISP